MRREDLLKLDAMSEVLVLGFGTFVFVKDKTERLCWYRNRITSSNPEAYPPQSSLRELPRCSSRFLP